MIFDYEARRGIGQYGPDDRVPIDNWQWLQSLMLNCSCVGFYGLYGTSFLNYGDDIES